MQNKILKTEKKLIKTLKQIINTKMQIIWMLQIHQIKQKIKK